MTPREALIRLRSTTRLAATEPELSAASQAAREASVRMSAILADLRTLPGAAPLQAKRSLPSRAPSAALPWLAVSDATAILAAFLLAWVAAHFGNLLFFDRSFASASLLEEGVRFFQFAALGAGVMLWFWHMGHYRQRQPFWMETQKIVGAFALAFVIDGFYHSLAKLDFSRLWMMGSWGFAACLVVAGRFFVRRRLGAAGLWRVRTLLVGGGATADETRAALRSAPEMGYDLVMQIENLPLVLASAGSWRRLCDRFDADYVVIALDGGELAAADEALAQLVREDIPFAVSPPMGRLPVLGSAPHYFFNHNVMLMPQAENLVQPLPRFFKRAMDLCGALAGIVVLGPVLLALAAWVRRDGGEIFYRDLRVGQDGRPFGCLKFRSMRVKGDEVLAAHLAASPLAQAEWNKYHKLRVDPRVTNIGAFMRKWSLDELPQLFNVLKGDMSLVGPRPVNVGESEHYRAELLQYMRVRPGLTGLWQVSGRSDVSFAGRVQMDAWYVRNWSLWLDIAILCKTLPVVFKKEGAF